MSPAGREIAGLTRKPPSLVGKLQQVVSFVLSCFCYSYWTFAQKKSGERRGANLKKRRVLLDTAIENHYQLAVSEALYLRFNKRRSIFHQQSAAPLTCWCRPFPALSILALCFLFLQPKPAFAGPASDDSTQQSPSTRYGLFDLLDSRSQ